MWPWASYLTALCLGNFHQNLVQRVFGRSDKKLHSGISLAVQWLRFWAPTAGGVGSVPGRGIKILHAARHSQKIKYSLKTAFGDRKRIWGTWKGTTNVMIMIIIWSSPLGGGLKIIPGLARKLKGKLNDPPAFTRYYSPVFPILKSCHFSCKSKPQWGTITRQSGWLLSKSLQAINAGEGVEKREPSYTVGGNAN